jgi:hypothetical protein
LAAPLLPPPLLLLLLPAGAIGGGAVVVRTDTGAAVKSFDQLYGIACACIIRFFYAF